ncbi:MAG: NUDIX domain-containing protein [archaeon]|jgi:8-oxo-dGTP pyrophosphatase MutT (NUDIX family)
MRTDQVECIIFRKQNKEYEFLLLKRIPAKGGFWQPISGGIETEDKSILDSAYREIKEEANISKNEVINVLENVHYFEMNKHYLTGEPTPLRKEYVFGFEVNPNLKISLDKNIYQEHEETKWVSLEEALKLLKWDNNKDGFKKLNNLLNLQTKVHQDNTINFIFNKDLSKVLMINRVKKYGFDWGFISGKIEGKEEAIIAAKREAKEELGIILEPIFIKSKKIEKDNQIYYHNYFFTIVNETTNLVIQKEEINEAKWFSVNDLPSNRAPDDLNYFLTKAKNQLFS